MFLVGIVPLVGLLTAYDDPKPDVTRDWKARSSWKYRVVIETEVGFDPVKIQYQIEVKRQPVKQGSEVLDEVRITARDLVMKSASSTGRNMTVIGESFAPFAPNGLLVPCGFGLATEDPLLSLPAFTLPPNLGTHEYKLNRINGGEAAIKVTLWKNQQKEFIVDGRAAVETTEPNQFYFQSAFDSKGVLRMASIVGKASGKAYRATVTRR
jgi:hypothetical protein